METNEKTMYFRALEFQEGPIILFYPTIRGTAIYTPLVIFIGYKLNVYLIFFISCVIKFLLLMYNLTLHLFCIDFNLSLCDGVNIDKQGEIEKFFVFKLELIRFKIFVGITKQC